LTTVGLTAVLAVPLLIGLAALRSPRWYPLTDMAQIEMRIRDVGLSHPPPLGLAGRIFGKDTAGAHPGPLSFYALAPFYRLLGSSAWAMQASAVTLEILALAGTVWAAQRRWRTWGAPLVAGGLALLMSLYGLEVMLYPWNPHLPVLFWVLFLVSVWGVLCDDLALLPVATVAGSLCAQTHLPYLGLVGGFGLAVAGVLAARFWRCRDDPRERRRLVWWTGLSGALGCLVWLPVVVEQITIGDRPGNLGIIVDSFRHPISPYVGPGDGVRLWLERLDPASLVQGTNSWGGSRWWGLMALVLWAGSAILALRMRDHTLVRLHAVVGLALGLGLIAASRIIGPPWPYLMLWSWGTATLALVAIVATAATVTTRLAGVSERGERRWRSRLLATALGLLVLVPTVRLARQAPDIEFDAQLSRQVAQLVPQVTDAIDDGTVPGGSSGTHLVTWYDPVNLGATGYGLMLELERQGYDVRARAAAHERRAVLDHRVVDPVDADAEIHVAVGDNDIQAWADKGDATRIAYFDLRTGEQRAEWQHLHDLIVADLEAADLPELAVQLDRDVFGLAGDPRLPQEVANLLFYLNQLPPPAAVFATPL
jgi:hypothetical protein